MLHLYFPMHPGPYKGTYVTLERLSVEAHGADLWARVGGEEHAGLWNFMGDGPFYDRESFEAALRGRELSTDPRFYSIVENARGTALGYAALMRDEPQHRAIEVGHLMFSAELQRTRAATEALYLMARYVFEVLNYRRYEWKCNALNAASRRAALRLGFQFEGIFRQHMLVKGRNRDTAWFSMLDYEWAGRKRQLERWLDASNFDHDGNQLTPLFPRVS